MRSGASGWVAGSTGVGDLAGHEQQRALLHDEVAEREVAHGEHALARAGYIGDVGGGIGHEGFREARGGEDVFLDAREE